MMRKWKWFVYIIECLDSTYYTGLTWNIPNRMDQHIVRLGSKYTQRHGFKKLVYHEEHENLEEARKREVQIKDWNQFKKRKLINAEFKKT